VFISKRLQRKNKSKKDLLKGVKKMKSFSRNLKAISPIFATLILIAIAVIAGVVVYMFTSGTLATMTSGGTAAQEKVAIQSVSGVASTHVVTAYCQSISGGIIKPDSALLKDGSGAVIGTANTAAITTNPAGGIGTSLNTVSITFTLSGSATMTAGTAYTVTLVSANGGNFVSSSFIAS
jgi:flagellin-like protein